MKPAATTTVKATTTVASPAVSAAATVSASAMSATAAVPAATAACPRRAGDHNQTCENRPDLEKKSRSHRLVSLHEIRAFVAATILRETGRLGANYELVIRLGHRNCYHRQCRW
jgi:hypothetical protein